MWWLTRRLARNPRLFIRLGNFETNLFEEQLAGIRSTGPCSSAGWRAPARPSRWSC
ncbi:MAG: hypothetical protein WDN69_06565 [Aliidongia sp.]